MLDTIIQWGLTLILAFVIITLGLTLVGVT
jgi:hypothetical protein